MEPFTGYGFVAVAKLLKLLLLSFPNRRMESVVRKHELYGVKRDATCRVPSTVLGIQ